VSLLRTITAVHDLSTRFSFVDTTSERMSLNARYLLTLPIFVLAAALLLNSKGRDHMTSLLQFGKSLFSARQTTMENAAATPSFYDRKFTDIKGQPMNMDELRGKVLLLVNTASECGYTPQLHTLQELQDKYKERGFSVLVRVFAFLFPCTVTYG
jgi:hypothetical protein